MHISILKKGEMIMKKFEYPEMEIEVFEVEDVITTSNSDLETYEDMGSWS